MCYSIKHQAVLNVFNCIGFINNHFCGLDKCAVIAPNKTNQADQFFVRAAHKKWSAYL